MSKTYKEEGDVKSPRRKRTYEEPEICPVCNGEGVIENPGNLDDMCQHCDGEGVLWR